MARTVFDLAAQDADRFRGVLASVRTEMQSVRTEAESLAGIRPATDAVRLPPIRPPRRPSGGVLGPDGRPARGPQWDRGDEFMVAQATFTGPVSVVAPGATLDVAPPPVAPVGSAPGPGLVKIGGGTAPRESARTGTGRGGGGGRGGLEKLGSDLPERCFRYETRPSGVAPDGSVMYRMVAVEVPCPERMSGRSSGGATSSDGMGLRDLIESRRHPRVTAWRNAPRVLPPGMSHSGGQASVTGGVSQDATFIGGKIDQLSERLARRSQEEQTLLRGGL